MAAEFDITQHDRLSGPALRKGSEMVKVLTDEAEFQLRVKGVAASSPEYEDAIRLAVVHQVNLLCELPVTFGLKTTVTQGINADTWIQGERPFSRMALELLEPVPTWPGLEPVPEEDDGYLIVTGVTGGKRDWGCGERARQWPPCQL